MANKKVTVHQLSIKGLQFRREWHKWVSARELEAKTSLQIFKTHKKRRTFASITLRRSVFWGIFRFRREECSLKQSPIEIDPIYRRPQVAPTLERMVKQFKGAITKKIGCSIWQKSFIEHIVRNQNDYETRLNYMYNNPMRWYYDKIYKDE